MKNFYLLCTVSMLMSLSFYSCSNDNGVSIPEGKGSIVLDGDIDLSVNEKTRAIIPLNDFTGYNLTVTDGGTDVFNGAVPTGGVVDNVPAGNYTVSLSNMAGFVPAFDAARFAGSKTGVEVRASEATPVSFNLTQANAAIKFIYDSSLDAIGVVAATVVQGSNALEYASNPNGVGYFAPGDVTLSFKVGTQTLKIGGQESITRTLAAADFLTMTLRVSTDKGKLILTISIDDSVNDRSETIGIDPAEPGGDGSFNIDGLVSTAVTVTFGDDSTANLTTDAEGNLDFTGHEGKLIKSITPSGGSAINIGRGTDEEINIKLAGNAIAFRDADNEGYIPIGVFAELDKIRDALGGKYKQEANIDMMDILFFSIAYNVYGSTDNQFTGEYDGGGYSLTNLYISGSGVNNTGFIGYNRGILRNLTIESGRVTSTRGNIGAFAGRNYGRVELCVNKAAVTAAAQMKVGGICGENFGTIRFCGNYGVVTGGTYTGGICGSSQISTGTDCVIEGCFNKADIPNGDSSSGGIVGQNYGKLTACYNIGNNTAPANKLNVAGVVGNNYGNDAMVTACYNIGTVGGMDAHSGSVGNNTGGSATIIDSYWSASPKVGKNSSPGTMSVYYFTDGTTAPDGATSGWPTADASKNWGIYATTWEGGYYWKNLGTSGRADYPELWWE